jgi:hypothetical protein
MSKIHNYFAYAVEGPLYSFAAEDGEAFSFDTGVEVLVSDGMRPRRYIHKKFYASGKCEDPEGLMHVAPSRAIANAFASKVNAADYIDLDYWEPVPPEDESLEERLAGYAREEEIERNGGRI